MSSSSERASVLFIRMGDAKDFETWLEVARCLGIWDGEAFGCGIQYSFKTYDLWTCVQFDYCGLGQIFHLKPM